MDRCILQRQLAVFAISNGYRFEQGLHYPKGVFTELVNGILVDRGWPVKEARTRTKLVLSQVTWMIQASVESYVTTYFEYIRNMRQCFMLHVVLFIYWVDLDWMIWSYRCRVYHC